MMRGFGRNIPCPEEATPAPSVTHAARTTCNGEIEASSSPRTSGQQVCRPGLCRAVE